MRRSYSISHCFHKRTAIQHRYESPISTNIPDRFPKRMIRKFSTFLSVFQFIYSKCLQQVVGAILVLLVLVFAAHVIGQRYDTRTWHLPRNHTDARSFAERSKIGRIVLFLGRQFFFSHLCAAKQTVKIIRQFHGQSQHSTYADFPITFMQCSRISSFDLPSMSMISSLPFSIVCETSKKNRHGIYYRTCTETMLIRVEGFSPKKHRMNGDGVRFFSVRTCTFGFLNWICGKCQKANAFAPLWCSPYKL